jgi:hypothetical protein
VQKERRLVCEFMRGFVQGDKAPNELETNQLAVLFEGLSVDAEGNRDLLFKLWVRLLKRYKKGLFNFSDGTARVDITGHVLHALKNMARSDAFSEGSSEMRVGTSVGRLLENEEVHERDRLLSFHPPESEWRDLDVGACPWCVIS